MKANHTYRTVQKDNGDVEVLDTFQILVGDVRQDSLYEQLKDLTVVANEIGCYDAGDYLKSQTEKIEAKENPKQIPNCYKCSDKLVQPDLFDSKHTYVCGCKSLTKQQWKKGMNGFANGVSYQTNCPLI